MVVAVAYDGLCLFEFGAVVEIFGLPRPEMGSNWYRFAVAAAEPGRLRALGSAHIAGDGGLELLGRADTIIVAGWRDVVEDPPAALVRALRTAHLRGARLVSICSGTFVLAAAGVLSGRNATTHWRYADCLRQKYPDIRVNADVLYIDEGDVLTSAGSAAGIDLCLHIVRRDFGPNAANTIARRLVIPPHREGGQAQYVERAVAPAREGGRFGSLFDRMRKRLHEPQSVSRLAAAAGMSRRTFLRRFKAATGSSPAAWLLEERLTEARSLLETTRRSIDDVASACGVGTADNLRHHFRRRFGVSPAGYRASFGRGSRAQQARWTKRVR
jgi:AraC family transcriptional activator FtrA